MHMIQNARWILAVACIGILLTGCGKHDSSTPEETKVVLGPIPSEAYMPDPLTRQTAGDMRKWVQNFMPSDAKKLNNTGKVVFSWEELKASYPEQARIVDDYVKQIRINFVEAIKKQSTPISNQASNRLAMHHTPDTVEIERLDRGKYRVVISSKEGIKHSFLEISEPR